MKHSLKVILLLVSLFFLAQLIGLLVIKAYSPQVNQVINEQGNITNVTSYNLPYGTEPPQGTTPRANLISIVSALFIAIGIMILLMRLHAETFLRGWFFVIVTIAIGITLYSPFQSISGGSLFALLIALPLAYIKVFKRHIITHNLTELMIYPGIAAIFVPLLNLWTISILLIIISLYDMYAVWHTGFMQKMAHYQIKTLRLFSGFFIPYLTKEQRFLLARTRNYKKKNVKMSVAILGGGDVVFPIMAAGVVLNQISFIAAMFISLGATAALISLFAFSKKGKFYPAMPFISAGCFIALGFVHLIF